MLTYPFKKTGYPFGHVVCLYEDNTVSDWVPCFSDRVWHNMPMTATTTVRRKVCCFSVCCSVVGSVGSLSGTSYGGKRNMHPTRTKIIKIIWKTGFHNLPSEFPFFRVCTTSTVKYWVLHKMVIVTFQTSSLERSYQRLIMWVRLPFLLRYSIHDWLAVLEESRYLMTHLTSKIL